MRRYPSVRDVPNVPCEYHDGAHPLRDCDVIRIGNQCDFGGCYRPAVATANWVNRNTGEPEEHRPCCRRCIRFARDLGYQITARVAPTEISRSSDATCATAVGDVTGYSQTIRLLAQLHQHATTTAARIAALTEHLTDLDLDAATIGAVADTLAAADRFAAAVDTAATGLTARHRGLAEALQTTPHAAAVTFYQYEPSTATPAPVSFADLDRDQRLEAMRNEIDAAMENLIDPEGWQRFLDSAAKFHRYTTSNVLLALAQRPEATLLAGYQDWRKKHGRTVRKGEKAIWILAPITHTVTQTDPDTGEKQKIRLVKGFRGVPVFDVAQTEGEPIAQPPSVPVTALDGDAPPGVLDELTNHVTRHGYTLHHEPLTGRDGYTDFATKKVVIDADAAPRHQLLTLAHELAHITLGHGEHRSDYHTGPGGRRPEMEIEAESVAYILARHHRIPEPGKASFGYIATWARGDKNKVRDVADRVLAAVRTLLNANERTEEAAPAQAAKHHARAARPTRRKEHDNGGRTDPRWRTRPRGEAHDRRGDRRTQGLALDLLLLAPAREGPTLPQAAQRRDPRSAGRLGCLV